MTVDERVVAPVLVTVNVAVVVPPFVSTTDTSLTEKEGAGSPLVIVPTPWASEIVAFTGNVRLTTNVSGIS